MDGAAADGSPTTADDSATTADGSATGTADDSATYVQEPLASPHTRRPKRWLQEWGPKR